ncbi:hypothetical protein SALBM135S_03093 [Streptomyces alboniger]
MAASGPRPTGVVYPTQATTAVSSPAAAYSERAIPAGVPYLSLARSKLQARPGTPRAPARSPYTSAI